ncbi:hypothetical protein G6O69_33685 [Pseudenhygromyxa sp. WMMC2535]|uniref:hypothetical protein n=1 Tax=Pseudenhygromyxa sp. WMMC2535 TaxID=2712867 RepID=UPI00159615A5|nr:hypothetical protein [Pseudenhygromyxa sp. WMMC2535]NVB42821.1 hypothetical protein [Pseudenhygromyxa sp. WMMC2535]
MLVIVHDACFRGSVTKLHALLHLCRLRGHALVSPFPPRGSPLSSAYAQWQRSQGPEVTELLRALKMRSRQLPAGSHQIEVVAASESKWSRAQLTLDDAISLLMAPLRLLVENGRSDVAFLERLVPAAYREQLDGALRSGALEIEHGGGLGEMKKILETRLDHREQDKPRRLRRLRTWVMFDRDADLNNPAEPSVTSSAVVALCERDHNERGDPWPLPWLQLGRRTIESYLPEETLELWVARARGNETKRRRETLEALKALRSTHPRVAWQLDMKKGLQANVSGEHRAQLKQARRGRKTPLPEALANHLPDDALPEFFHGLTMKQRGALAFGFGDDIAEGFHEDLDGERFIREYERGPNEQSSAQTLVESILTQL